MRRSQIILLKPTLGLLTSSRWDIKGEVTEERGEGVSVSAEMGEAHRFKKSKG